ncbi:hypothetical protein SK128_009338 [Halocaridina rubra]|uniref:RING-type domain-containing protein n=1 Tax=Halocaridina rubra TaxID=373956 RepID=A0AAN9A0Y7_HALRR
MQDLSEVDSCDICTETYDGNLRPHSLPCGHTICSCCITNSIDDGILKCPHCQKSHTASSVDDFPVNYRMESIILILKGAQKGTIPRASAQSESRSLKSRALIIVGEQRDSLRSILKVTESVRSDVDTYRNHLQEQKDVLTELNAKISDILSQIEEIALQIDSEDNQTEEQLQEGKELERNAVSYLRELEDLTRVNDLVTPSEDLEKICKTLDKWNTECTARFPSVQMISNLDKITRATETALNVISKTYEDAAPSEVPEHVDPALTIMEKIQKITGGAYLSLNRLKSMSPFVKSLLERGKVYAIQNKDGFMRSARITKQDNKCYLHYLQNEEITQHVYVVKHSDVVDSLNTDSIVAFLDLEWDGSVRGRVHINLSPDTPLAKHFWTLCTGHLGPSYALTKFLSVKNKGHQTSERVEGGDYENNNGTGGAPLFAGLKVKDDIYERRKVVGRVTANHGVNDGPKSAQFRIYTGTKEGKTAEGIYGHVQDGLDVVREAVKLNDVSKVTIVDCGVVLPF